MAEDLILLPRTGEGRVLSEKSAGLSGETAGRPNQSTPHQKTQDEVLRLEVCKTLKNPKH